MKVIKEKKKEKLALPLRLNPDLVEKIDQIAQENEISRQKLIEAILGQVINDKKFVLKLKE